MSYNRVSANFGCLRLQDLKPYQRAHRLTRMPSVLEGLSYLFAAGNLLAGPHFELSDYLVRAPGRRPEPARRLPPAPAGALRMD
jgi:hypothetical protein